MCFAALGGCANPSQERYGHQDVGRAVVVEFGTVLAVRPVEITGRNSGLGGAVGAAAGGIGASTIGRGSGTAGAILAGVVLGGIAGALVEQAASDRTGIEYTITLASGKTLTIVQEQLKTDRVFGVGERVMVQSGGAYNRVLPADRLPVEIARPKDIKVRD
jgi:outer membrane lipoprotein SlyB